MGLLIFLRVGWAGPAGQLRLGRGALSQSTTWGSVLMDFLPAETKSTVEATDDSKPEPFIKAGSRLAQIIAEEEVPYSEIEGFEDENNVLGNGAFGEVRKVLWRKTPVAAKVSHACMSAEQKHLILRELELMVKVRHPNIVQFLGFVDTPFVMLMEFLPMGDLRMYWRAHKVSVGHKIDICIDILRGLGYLHNRKPSAIIHRDVKPTNVLMTRSGVAKLTDFGLGRIKNRKGAYDASKHGASAHGGVLYYMGQRNGSQKRLSDEAIRDATQVVGTAMYMAPEANGKGYDEKVDIYSAGITFCELFEQGYDPDVGVAWAIAPMKVFMGAIT